MKLDARDLNQFFTLRRALMFFVNQRLQAIPGELATREDFARLTPEVRHTLQNALLENLHLIELFVAENPAQLSAEELEIVRSWQHPVSGKFFIFRHLKNYTVFLSAASPAVAYGVLPLTQPLEELVGPHLPVLIGTTLLPFKNKIVYDGLLLTYRISAGPGFRQNLNQDFKDAKARHGIVASLPMSQEPMPIKAPKARPAPKAPSKEANDEHLNVVLGLVEQFCKEHLNEEYAGLCRKLAEKLGRKRPSPLLQGSPNAWASGIVRAIGGANFLHDKTQKPYMRSTDIDYYLGTSPSSGAAKLAAIRKMFRIYQLDPNWTLPSRLKDNPMVWMLQVDGLVLDIRNEPRELQQLAFQKGLIPYIPADRGGKPVRPGEQ